MTTIIGQGLGSSLFVLQGYAVGVVVIPPAPAPLPGYAVYVYSPAPGTAQGVPAPPLVTPIFGVAIFGLATFGAPPFGTESALHEPPLAVGTARGV
jgi:hypothetical protein